MAGNSAKEENLLSTLGGIRNAVDETKKLREENTRLRTAIEKVLPVLEKEYRHLAVERDFDGKYDGVPREEIPDAWPVRILKEALAGK